MTRIPRSSGQLLLLILAATSGAHAQDDVSRLSGALAAGTPMVEDLRDLADRIGGRATGSAANRAAVAWALERFRAAGVTARTESFRMPALWLERRTTASVGGAVSFPIRAAAAPWSAATTRPASGPVVDGGRGTEADFQRLGGAVRGAWVLIGQEPLTDLDGLFREYGETAEIERRAWEAGAIGVAYESSRPEGVLYRHNAALGWDNRHPVIALERAGAARLRRLLAGGAALRLTASVDAIRGGPYTADNVIGEIPGTTRAGEVVVIGAHLDSWDLGQGALDNGANVAILIDIARQIARLGLRPARTIRFVLWNGEEQGLVGSWRYTEQHADELDRTVLAASFDIGTGNIVGFFTGGRPDVLAATQRALEPLTDLGPWQHLDAPVVGTDNYDFMLQGVPNLVANQASANYGPNYHAATDTFDKADTAAMRRNARIAAAVTWHWANADQVPGRQTMAQVEELVRSSDLRAQMRMLGDLRDRWDDRTRPRRP
jgi:hypothetical protein